MFRWTHVAVALTLGMGAVRGQEMSPDLEARLRELERKAESADVLAVRVRELESLLADYGVREREQELEYAIEALTQDAPVGTVVPARSQKLVFGGQLRLRFEYRTVGLYQAADPKATDDDIVIQRTRFNVNAHVLDGVRVFAEFQDSRLWGEEMDVLTDLEGVDLHQGYVAFEDLWGSGLNLWAGRFELSLWNQRFVSPLDWHPVGRSWDGVRVFGEVAQDLKVEAVYTIIAEDIDLDAEDDAEFAFGALTYTGVEDLTLGSAIFWQHARNGTNDFSYGTAAFHADGRFSGFDFAVDLAAQFGDREDQDVHAYASALTLGYTFEGGWKPRIGAEWTWASGDRDPNDGDMGSFESPFAFVHAYQGYMDLFTWKNGHDLAFHLDLRPADSWKVELVFHGFWLDSSDDAWYGINQRPIRFNQTVGSREIGYELDLAVRHDLAPGIWLWFGYSHFFAGEYVEDTGRAPDNDWVWCQFTAAF